MSTPVQIDETALGAICAIAVASFKIIELLVSWVVKQFGPSKEDESKRVVVVQLDPEVSRMIRETHEVTRTIGDVTSIRDKEGVPLVYSSRTMADNVSTIAACMRDVSSSQERISKTLDKVIDKVDKVDDKVDDLAKRK